MTREEVIKGLECCSHEDIGDCYNCPYNAPTPHCDIAMMRDALALLKAQEPRVMTVDDIKELDDGAVVWVEFSDGRLLPMVVDGGCLMRWQYIWRICDGMFYDDDYKSRAWTSRPTDKQRKAVKWDG